MKESWFTRDKDFYKRFLSLMALLVLQNLISYSVNLADNVMLGRFGQNELSGAATVNQIQFLLQQITLGLGEGLVALSAQYWGRKDVASVKKITGIALKIAIVGSVILFMVVSLFPRQILTLFTTDEAIITCGMEYLRILRFTYPIFIVTNILLASLRSVETVRIAFYISISTLIINVGMNYTLIYGNFGAPRLGLTGAAIGTLTARIVEFLIVLFFICKKEDKLHIRIGDLQGADRELIQNFLILALPATLLQGLFGISQALQTIILGHLDVNAIAANSAATAMFQYLKIIAIGSASATSVVIGKAVGAGDMKKVREYARTLQVVFLCCGLFICIGLNMIRGPLLQFYSLNPDAKMLANEILILLSITGIGTAYEMPVLGGIIRGGGDSKFFLKLDLISLWCIMYPLSFMAAFWWKLPTIVVVAFINSDQVFKCLPAFIKVNRFDWIHQFGDKKKKGV